MIRRSEPITDQELLESYRQGAAAAFEVILERYEAPLLRYAARYRPRTAQDLVQEVFLRLVRESRKLNGVESLSAWLYRVTRHLAIDEARKEARMQVRHRTVAVSEVQPTAPVAVEGAELNAVVTAHIEALPEKQREVVILKLQEQRSYKDISAITGLSVTNVGYLIHKGLKKLSGDLRRAGVV